MHNVTKGHSSKDVYGPKIKYRLPCSKPVLLALWRSANMQQVCIKNTVQCVFRDIPSSMKRLYLSALIAILMPICSI
jgi:hypothetical protein